MSEKVYTTGEIAKRLQVSAKTVIKWIENEGLKAYRVGRCRRVLAAELHDFMKRSDIPMSLLE